MKKRCSSNKYLKVMMAKSELDMEVFLQISSEKDKVNKMLESAAGLQVLERHAFSLLKCP